MDLVEELSPRLSLKKPPLERHRIYARDGKLVNINFPYFHFFLHYLCPPVLSDCFKANINNMLRDFVAVDDVGGKEFLRLRSLKSLFYARQSRGKLAHVGQVVRSTVARLSNPNVLLPTRGERKLYPFIVGLESLLQSGQH